MKVGQSHQWTNINGRFSENRVPRKLGPKGDEVTGGWGKLRSERMII
jgi:hypothetical protein